MVQVYSKLSNFRVMVLCVAKRRNVGSTQLALRRLTIGVSNASYARNEICSRRFTWVSFLPLSLFLHFRKYSNCYFLLIASLMYVPGLTGMSPLTAMAPLIFVLLVSLIREFFEELMAYNRDWKVNMASVIMADGRTSTWASLCAGDLIRIVDGECVPADCLLLKASNSDGLALIETSTLDGESNLKRKRTVASDLTSFIAEAPHSDMYKFSGAIGDQPLTIDNMLLRGSILRNTAWVEVCVVYAGPESKVELNAASRRQGALAGASKLTKLDRLMNTSVCVIFALQVVLCLFACFMEGVLTPPSIWYLEGFSHGHRIAYEGQPWLMQFLSFIILVASLIPSSLWAACEVTRIWQAHKIESQSCGRIKCNSRVTHDDAGQVSHVFTDKTGTLTSNELEFYGCCIGSEILTCTPGDEPAFSPISFAGVTPPSAALAVQLRSRSVDAKVNRFLSVLATCHSCDGDRAASSDEGCLVVAAASAGIFNLDCDVLHVFDFTSERRMMTVVVKLGDEVVLFSKGADSSILPRCSSGDVTATEGAIDTFCRQGLRVMCVACKSLTLAQWQLMETKLEQAHLDEVLGQTGRVAEVASFIESDLEILGCTALKDSLQDQVPRVLFTMKSADIKVAIITGDKMETAIGVAQSCGLISSRNNVYSMISHPRMFGAGNFVPLMYLSEVKDMVSESSAVADAETIDDTSGLYSVVVDGVALESAAIHETVAKRLVDVVNHPQCEAAVFCRVSPKQKGQIITMFRKYSPGSARFLAVGDGANDMNMLRLSDVGVGIVGKEGSQAANSADYAVRAFIDVYELMFVHGRSCSFRLSNFVHLFLYKNCALALCQIWFAFYSDFSAQSIFNDWYLLLYNSAFGLGALLLASVSDNDASVHRELYGDKVSEWSDVYWEQRVVAGLYKEGKTHFTVKTLCKWMALGAVQSVVLFFGCLYLLDIESDLCGFGIVLYTAVIFVISLMTMLCTFEWTKTFMLCLLSGNFILYAVFVICYNGFRRLTTFYQVSDMFSGGLRFWAFVAVLSAACWIPVLASRASRLFELRRQVLSDRLNALRRGCVVKQTSK